MKILRLSVYLWHDKVIAALTLEISTTVLLLQVSVVAANEQTTSVKKREG